MRTYFLVVYAIRRDTGEWLQCNHSCNDGDNYYDWSTEFDLAVLYDDKEARELAAKYGGEIVSFGLNRLPGLPKASEV